MKQSSGRGSTWVYAGVISSEVFDLIVERALLAGDLRVGLDLIRRAVLNVEQEARMTVEADDIGSAFEASRNNHKDVRFIKRTTFQIAGQADKKSMN